MLLKIFVYIILLPLFELISIVGILKVNGLMQENKKSNKTKINISIYKQYVIKVYLPLIKAE